MHILFCMNFVFTHLKNIYKCVLFLGMIIRSHPHNMAVLSNELWILCMPRAYFPINLISSAQTSSVPFPICTRTLKMNIISLFRYSSFLTWLSHKTTQISFWMCSNVHIASLKHNQTELLLNMRCVLKQSSPNLNSHEKLLAINGFPFQHIKYSVLNRLGILSIFVFWIHY